VCVCVCVCVCARERGRGAHIAEAEGGEGANILFESGMWGGIQPHHQAVSVDLITHPSVD